MSPFARSAWHTVFGVGLLGAASFAATSWWMPRSLSATAQTTERSITPAQVSQVEQALRGVDPSLYRINLPVFQRGKVVGNRTYGSLPLAQVRQVASAQRINLAEKGNLQLVMDPNAAGQSSGANTGGGGASGGGGGANSPTNGANSMQPANGKKLAQTLERIMAGVDRNQYVLLKPLATRQQVLTR